MIVKALFPLLGTPDANAIAHEPLHHKGRFVRNATDPVKHENQQDIKFPLLCVFFDNLQLITVGRPYLVAGYALFLFFVKDCPAFVLGKLPAGFSLHGDICLVLIRVIHLLIGRYTI